MIYTFLKDFLFFIFGLKEDHFKAWHVKEDKEKPYQWQIEED
jgi:hypothetical protein